MFCYKGVSSTLPPLFFLSSFFFLQQIQLIMVRLTLGVIALAAIYAVSAVDEGKNEKNSPLSLYVTVVCSPGSCCQSGCRM